MAHQHSEGNGMAPQDIELTTRSAAPQGSGGCGCCSPGPEKPSIVTRPSRESTAQFQVLGLTCSGCASTVTKQLRSMDGVGDVDIALVPDGASTVTVSSSLPLSRLAVAAAIADAGYTVVPAE